MKILKTICFACLIIFAPSCSNDDNGDSSEKTTRELLTTGKWYQESKSPGSFTDCEKNGYVEFMDNGDAIVDIYDDFSGTCESLGAIIAEYTLSNNIKITITFGADVTEINIEEISDDELVLKNVNDGEIIRFDRTPG
ncbi:lipocalin-like domain-containing protein [Pseudotamlana agarivorans]|uniref:lipocalin family protein n=1 Tax=Pseudotamlana agarivorans TaxID=481183 RepID=UPI000836E204|nr:lipocalin family protein [Tamlana agarivorans]